ncbi:MAG: MBL fold metallo-hydrolase [Thermodesulfobacteriota bacterium]
MKGNVNAPALVFLGTGAAWRTPELGCSCGVCQRMRREGESRTRTALWFEGPSRLLVDCGPDVAWQMEANGLDRPEAVLITHEHGDHFLGLDELEAFRRREPAESFRPLPCYAHPEAWPALEQRFGYLLGKLLERREARPGRPLEGLDGPELTVVPFKTDHGPLPRGSVGYAIRYAAPEGRSKVLVYTSDFKDVPEPTADLCEPDVLVAQSHWFNEPDFNRPAHMSLQRLTGFIRAWRPREHVYLVHLSDADLLPGEEGRFMKKRPPLSPLIDPETRRPFPTPSCQREWQAAAEAVFKAHGIATPVTVARDGLRAPL